MSLFNKLSSESLHLNLTEKRIVDEILKNYSNFDTIKIADLSSKLFISSTAIVRLCKKLGYTGFSELKYQIKLDKNAHNHNEEINFDEELTLTVNQTIKLNSRESIMKSAKLMFDAEQIVFFALGLSKTVALDLSKKLSCLNKIAIVPDDRDSCISFANNLHRNQLAVFISLTGSTDIIKKLSYITKTKNIFTIAFTGVSQSPLISHASISLFAYHNHLDMFNEDINSRLGLYILSELVFNEYLKIYKANTFNTVNNK